MMKRFLRYFLPEFLILIVLLLAAGSLVYSPGFLVRVLRWGDADVYDYQKFHKWGMILQRV